MAEHLSDVWELFKDDPHLTFYLFQPFEEKLPGEIEYVSNKIPVRKTSKTELYLRHWDLVIAADHPGAVGTLSHIINTFSWPTLRIPHGVPGKRVDGQIYAFNSQCYDERGEIRYTRMLVSSETERQMAVEADPGFSDRVVIVGNLKSDRLLEMAQYRDEIRQRFGVGPGDIFVLTLSTFGPNCLFNMMGNELIDEMRRHSDLFHFALSVHPLEYRSKGSGGLNWGERLAELVREGFVVRDPKEDWRPYMLACDVILTDHTSLALYGVSLGRPYVYAPVSETLVEKDSLTWHLLAISPMLRADGSNLKESLWSAMNDYPLGKLKDLNQMLNSFPREAEARIRREVYSLLK